jgi:hypothetical protein
MDAGAAMGGAGLLVSIAGVIYSAVNHKHIKSRCCGKEYEVSLDIGTSEEGKKEKTEIVGGAKDAKEVKPEPKVEAKEPPSFVYKSKISTIVPKFNIDP